MASCKSLINLVNAVSFAQDKNQDKKELAEETFKKIGEAYKILSDKNERAAYDRDGKSGAGLPGAGNANPFANMFTRN